MQADSLDLLQEVQNHAQYTLAKLKHYINRGYYEFVKKTKCIEGSVTITTVANQFSYTISDAANLAYVYIPFSVRYIRDSDVYVGDVLKPWPGGYGNLPKKISYSSLPRYYWLKAVHTNTSIEVGTWPVADEDDKTIKIDAFMWPVSELSDDADIPNIKLAYHDALVYYAVSRIFGMVGHLQPEWKQKSLFYLSEFERLVSEANEFMAYQSDEPIEIEDFYQQLDYGYE